MIAKFCYVAKISLHSEIFAIIAKFSLCSVNSLHSEISLYSKNFCYSEIVLLHVLGSNDPVLVFSISTLTVMILFRIDWVFHLFVRLYKPSYKHFET